MYGKYFASTFTGSMFGAGCEVFAVWGYVIANAVDSTVELNADYLSAVLGCPTDRIAAAITRLCSADPKSRTPDKHGVRLEHLNGFTYHVVNHAIYRALRNEEERRVYNRDAKRKERAKVKLVVNDKHTLSKMSAHTEAEAEAEAEAEPKAKRERKTAPAALSSLSPSSNDALTDRAAAFLERYQALYMKYRKGAHYHHRPIDFQHALELCRTWEDDARLDKIAQVFLTTDHTFAEEGSRTVGQFAALASWCDGRLREAGL